MFFEPDSRLKTQDSRLKTQDSRLQASAVAVFFSATAFLFGCSGSSPESTAPLHRTNVSKSLVEICYDGGYVFAENDHVVGVDVSKWALSSVSQVQKIHSSCDCVRATIQEMDGTKKLVAVVVVDADSKLSKNASPAVRIEAVLNDQSTRILSFEFTHVPAVKIGRN